MQKVTELESRVNECCQIVHDALYPLLEPNDSNHQTLLRCLNLLQNESDQDGFRQDIKELISEVATTILKESSDFSLALAKIWSPQVSQLLTYTGQLTDVRSSECVKTTGLPRVRSFENLDECLINQSTPPAKAIMSQAEARTETTSPRERILPKRLSAVMTFEPLPGPIQESQPRTAKPPSPRESPLSPTLANTSKTQQVGSPTLKEQNPMPRQSSRRNTHPARKNSFWIQNFPKSTSPPEPPITITRSESL